jgi:hypothetical protein
MKTLTTRSELSIAQEARSEAGKADFISLLWNEETKELSLNDPGDIAIPSRTTRSINLQMRWDDECIENVIRGFLSQLNKERC